MEQAITVDTSSLPHQDSHNKFILKPNNSEVCDQYYRLICKLADQLSFRVSADYHAQDELKNELIQEGVVALLQANEKFDHRKGVKPITYFYPCIKGAMLNYINREQDYSQSIFSKNGSAHLVSLSSPMHSFNSDDDRVLLLEDTVRGKNSKSIPEKVIINKYINNALKKLTSKQKCVLKLHFWEGYKMAEIADLMGVSRSRVTSLLQSALNKMKMELVTA